MSHIVSSFYVEPPIVTYIKSIETVDTPTRHEIVSPSTTGDKILYVSVVEKKKYTIWFLTKEIFKIIFRKLRFS